MQYRVARTSHGVAGYVMSRVRFPINFMFMYVCGSGTIIVTKVKLSLQQLVEAHRVVRRRGSHIF
jgi:hypothetical protein